jgi:hypothetical protein
LLFNHLSIFYWGVTLRNFRLFTMHLRIG